MATIDPLVGEVAQLVEHTTENRGVASSILALAIFLICKWGLALPDIHGGRSSAVGGGVSGPGHWSA